MNRILLTGGRTPAPLALARNLHASGHEVFVAESFPYHLCRVSRAVRRHFEVPAPRQAAEDYIDALKAIIRLNQIEYLIPTGEEVFYVARGFATLSPYCRVGTAPLAALLPLHHKARFIDLVRQLELPVPQTWCARSAAELHDVFDTLPRGSQWVLKPAYSRLGTRIKFLWPEDPIPTVEISDDHAWLVQQFINGRQLCTYSIARQGRLQAHAAYQAIYTTPTSSCIYFEALAHDGLKQWVRNFVERQAYSGQIAFDFIEGLDGTLYPIECNPRTTGGLLLLAHQPNLFDAFFGDVRELMEPVPGARHMLAAEMIGYALPRDRNHSAWWRAFWGARDVIFRWSDPAPAMYQAVSMAALWRRSRRTGMSVAQASTIDTEWNSER